MLTLMLFMFFFFLGFVAMFYYLLRRLDNQCQQLSDEHAQLRVLLRAIESRLDPASFGGQPQNEQEQPSQEKAVHDSLLHLSFDDPSADAKKPAPGYGLDINFDQDEQNRQN